MSKGELLWSDEFDYTGSPNPDEWQIMKGEKKWGNNDLQYYDESNIQVKDGCLTIEARLEDKGTSKYTSGRMLSKRKFKYGVFEMKAILPKGRGQLPAFWLSIAYRPKEGLYPEIDIMEHVTFRPNSISCSLHAFQVPVNSIYKKSGYGQIENDEHTFQTFKLEWTPTSLRWFVNDHEFMRIEKSTYPAEAPWVYDNELYLVINNAIGGNWAGQHGIDDSAFPSHFRIAYVRHYALKHSHEDL